MSPHQPFQLSSSHSPRTGPNMFRPRMKAPKPSIERWAKVSSTPSEPPPSPNMALKVFVPTNQRWSSVPRFPRGSWRLCSGPAPNPSRDKENPATPTRPTIDPSTALQLATLLNQCLQSVSTSVALIGEFWRRKRSSRLDPKRQIRTTSAQTHSKDFRDHHLLGTPTIGTAGGFIVGFQREAKPPLHLLFGSLAPAAFSCLPRLQHQACGDYSHSRIIAL